MTLIMCMCVSQLIHLFDKHKILNRYLNVNYVNNNISIGTYFVFFILNYNYLVR